MLEAPSAKYLMVIMRTLNMPAVTAMVHFERARNLLSSFSTTTRSIDHNLLAHPHIRLSRPAVDSQKKTKPKDNNNNSNNNESASAYLLKQNTLN